MSLSSDSRFRERKSPPHVCDPLACGITYDPGCPIWNEPSPEMDGRPWRHLLHPEEQQAFHRWERLLESLPKVREDVRRGVARALIAVLGEDLRPELMRLLAPDLGKLVQHFLDRRGEARR